MGRARKARFLSNNMQRHLRAEQLTGMPQAIPNTVTEDVRFVLNVSAGNPIICVAKYGVATHIASGLGTAVKVLVPRLKLWVAQGIIGSHERRWWAATT